VRVLTCVRRRCCVSCPELSDTRGQVDSIHAFLECETGGHSYAEGVLLNDSITLLRVHPSNFTILISGAKNTAS
jgi:hypothetical protein